NILAFVHIPKTAGTSARQALQQAVGLEHSLSIGVNITLDEFASLTPEKLANTKVLFGHASADEFRRIGAPLRFATAVRDPVARAISYFNFITVRRADSPLAKKIGGRSILAATTNVKGFQRNISNMQCRMICGEANADKAIETIEKEDWLIAKQADLDSLLQNICEEFGWEWTPAPKANVGKKGYTKSLMAPDVEEAIRSLNREDEKLVEHITSRTSHAVIPRANSL
ncbi:MAG: hypothetical protein VYC38_14725, partial [Pseudomonadota bacterium]|nr:hypothetical protein [Pseudomonadota bacterium]